MKLLVVLSLLLVACAIAQECKPSETRTDCGFMGITQDQCVAKGCCWAPAATFGNPNDTPWCFYKSGVSYDITSIQPITNGYRAYLKLKASLPPNIETLRAEITFETEDRVRIKITDATRDRWEIPSNVVPTPGVKSPLGDLRYKFTYTTSPAAFAITRLADGEVVFSTSGLVFQDQYLSLSLALGSDTPKVYGFGERAYPLLLDTNAHSYTLWNADSANPYDQNEYGSHPFHMEMRNGKAHGVFLRNSNGMDIVLNKNQLTYKVIGGVLDFYVFIGPKPEDVVKQYEAVIGNPAMPPYWSLGWHQCRYGWPNLDTVKSAVNSYAQKQIPLDTVWADIDYMSKWEDFTFDSTNFPADRMRDFATQLHGAHQHYVPIVDPGIHQRTGYPAWDQGLAQGVFIKKADGVTPFIGKVWPEYTAFPDWFHPKTQAYWNSQIKDFFNTVPFDGLWIDMNEVSNFLDGSNSADRISASLPYNINNMGRYAPLNTKTLAMDALHYPNITEFNAHNLYGLMEAIATRKALLDYAPNKRPFLLTRSTFPGSGAHTFMWLGDNFAEFGSMKLSVAGVLAMNMMGVPMVGADVCGFLNDANEELCIRWHELAAFYPFARNHHDIHTKEGEPWMWDSVTRVAKKVLGARYQLLPYFYTLFYQAHAQGGTVVRPLFFEFPSDSNTLPIDTQMLIGSGLLVSPVLTQGATNVWAYLPPAAVWYDFWTGAPQQYTGWINYQTPLESIQVHVRGGTILPMQGAALTTYDSLRTPSQLLVALAADASADGLLFADDGESANVGQQALLATFHAQAGTLTSTVLQNTYTPPSNLGSIKVLGVSQAIKSVTVNGASVSTFTYDAGMKSLTISNLNVPLTQTLKVSWSA